MINAYVLLGKILERFQARGISKVQGYKGFEYSRETDRILYVKRENGREASIPFEKIIDGIMAFHLKPELYDQGPSRLREYGITHITSPVWSLLHLVPMEVFEKKEYRKQKTNEISVLGESGILEHELATSWRIYGLALKAYHHADHLFLTTSEEERKIISFSASLKFLRVVCARTCALEITKLLAKGRNNHYSFWNLLARLRKKRFVGNINVSTNTLDEIEKSLFINKQGINRVKEVRDKIVAHDDLNNYSTPTTIFSDLMPLLELSYSILCKLSVEQYQKDCPPSPELDKNIDLFDGLNLE